MELEPSAEVLSRLERYKPLRVVVKLSEQGVLLGLVENSFSMSFEREFINIFWSGPAYWEGTPVGNINAEKDSADFEKDGAKVYDPLSPDCPVQINWQAWLDAIDGKKIGPRALKYYRRNAPFKVKEQENYRLVQELSAKLRENK